MNWAEVHNLKCVTTKQPLKHKKVQIKQYQYIKGNILRTTEIGRILNHMQIGTGTQVSTKWKLNKVKLDYILT